MKISHLSYFENCKLPVIILLWIESEDSFYYLFAQKYIKETLFSENPNWIKQKTATIRFNSKLEKVEDLNDIAIEGYLYIAKNNLQINDDANYCLDGLLKSENDELRERSLNAFIDLNNFNYTSAIKEFEDIIRELTILPEEKMLILMNLGAAYFSISEYEKALINFNSALKLEEKVSAEYVTKIKAGILSNMGLVYQNCNPEKSLDYLNEALKIYKNIGDMKRVANRLGNMGIVYFNKGELDKALEYYKKALKIHQNIGYKKGESNQLGNIGLVFLWKDEPMEALKYHEKSLKIDIEIGDTLGESNQLGNIGITMRRMGDVDKALEYLKKALKIQKEIDNKEGQALQYISLGLVLRSLGKLDNSLENHLNALKIHEETSNKNGEAIDLANIGFVYFDKKEWDESLKYLKKALDILDEINSEFGRKDILQAIKLIEFEKKEIE